MSKNKIDILVYKAQPKVIGNRPFLNGPVHLVNSTQTEIRLLKCFPTSSHTNVWLPRIPYNLRNRLLTHGAKHGIETLFLVYIYNKTQNPRNRLSFVNTDLSLILLILVLFFDRRLYYLSKSYQASLFLHHVSL